jgi:hypothetical protein
LDVQRSLRVAAYAAVAASNSPAVSDFILLNLLLMGRIEVAFGRKCVRYIVDRIRASIASPSHCFPPVSTFTLDRGEAIVGTDGRFSQDLGGTMHPFPEY